MLYQPKVLLWVTWFNFNQESKYWEKWFLEKILWENIFNGNLKNLHTKLQTTNFAKENMFC